jgi:hypothetical protein
MKIFCIGYNKTGTTSLERLMNNNNINSAPQKPFECNMESYFYKNYSTFVNMIKDDYHKYDFFQDIPFSLPNFYKVLDEEFDDAKFILTVRDNEDEWYDSLIRFYKKVFVNFDTPKKISYTYEGLIYKILTLAWNSKKDNPYDEKLLKESYLKHIKDVKEYFKDKNNLLIINLSQNNVIEKIENYLNIELKNKEIPHLNKTK